mgnify:CR=1 FL=1
MNEQKAPGMIEWTRIRNADDTIRRGWTWNPIAGCEHACTWTMPTGEVAVCYAKSQAESVRLKKFYPETFDHHYWHPSRLAEPLRAKEGGSIFVCSMSDLMGHWVTDAEIEAVLDIMRRAPWHVFQILTKNPRRLLTFDFPANVWVGASMPPDSMYGKALSELQKDRMMRITLETLAQVKTPVRWVSFEPLSWNTAPLMAHFAGAIQWAVIGAASNGKTLYAPNDGHVQALVEVLEDQGCSVFYKGNLKASPWAAANWRDGFPTVAHFATVAAPVAAVEPLPLTTKEMF